MKWLKKNWKKVLFWGLLPLSILVILIILFSKGNLNFKIIQDFLTNELDEETDRLRKDTARRKTENNDITSLENKLNDNISNSEKKNAELTNELGIDKDKLDRIFIRERELDEAISKERKEVDELKRRLNSRGKNFIP